MKIELKRKIDNKWRYVDIHEYHGVPMLTILATEQFRPDACIKVTNEGRVSIITNDMAHHCYYINKGFTIYDLDTGINLLTKYFGEKMLAVVPEYVHEVFPGSALVGWDDEQKEI